MKTNSMKSSKDQNAITFMTEAKVVSLFTNAISLFCVEARIRQLVMQKLGRFL